MNRNTKAWILSSLAWALHAPRPQLLVQDKENEFLSSLGMASMQDPDSIWSEIFDRYWAGIHGVNAEEMGCRLDELEVEYTRLFFGPPFPALLPYEHAYREWSDAASLCVDLKSLYQSRGFEMSGDFHDLPDHIGAELEFAATLVSEGLEEQVESFRSGHLQLFMRAYAEKLREESRLFVMDIVADALLAMAAEVDWCVDAVESEELLT